MTTKGQSSSLSSIRLSASESQRLHLGRHSFATSPHFGKKSSSSNFEPFWRFILIDVTGRNVLQTHAVIKNSSSLFEN